MPGRHHSSEQHLVAGARPEHWLPARGYEWVEFGKRLRVKWGPVKGRRDRLNVSTADGSRLASASREQTVTVWDARSGRETLTLKGYTSLVICVALSPNGIRIACSSYYKTVNVWTP